MGTATGGPENGSEGGASDRPAEARQGSAVLLAHPDACGVLLVDSESVDGRLLDFQSESGGHTGDSDGVEKKVLSPIVAMALHP